MWDPRESPRRRHSLSEFQVRHMVRQRILSENVVQPQDEYLERRVLFRQSFQCFGHGVLHLSQFYEDPWVHRKDRPSAPARAAVALKDVAGSRTPRIMIRVPDRVGSHATRGASWPRRLPGVSLGHAPAPGSVNQ